MRILGKGKFALRKSELLHSFSNISTFSCVLRKHEKGRCELAKRINRIERSEIDCCEMRNI